MVRKLRYSQRSGDSELERRRQIEALKELAYWRDTLNQNPDQLNRLFQVFEEESIANVAEDAGYEHLGRVLADAVLQAEDSVSDYTQRDAFRDAIDVLDDKIREDLSLARTDRIPSHRRMDDRTLSLTLPDSYDWGPALKLEVNSLQSQVARVRQGSASKVPDAADRFMYLADSLGLDDIAIGLEFHQLESARTLPRCS